MPATPPPYKPGQWIVVGIMLGGFLGLVFGKFALGLIFGFWIGIAIDADKKKAARKRGERDNGPIS